MVLHSFAALSCLSAVVWAGGYQGCLERVWLFQAYEIDALNPTSDQQIGFKCMDWNDVDRVCIDTNGLMDNYRACAGTRPGGRCSFDELMNSLERPGNQNQNWNAEALDPATGRLDTRQTAINCYNRYEARRATVPNFPAWKAMKGQNVWEYNAYILRLGDKVNDAYMKKGRPDNHHLWQDFDDTRDQINIARAGDHGPHLIEAANEHVGGIYTQDLGRHPVTGEQWMTVDWAETVRRARANGDNNAGNRIRTFLDGFYHVAGEARRHYMVFKSYKRVFDRSVSCGRRGV